METASEVTGDQLPIVNLLLRLLYVLFKLILKEGTKKKDRRQQLLTIGCEMRTFFRTQTFMNLSKRGLRLFSTIKLP